MNPNESTGRNSLGTVSIAVAGQAVYSLATAAELADVHPDMVRYYWEHGLLGHTGTSADTEPVFDDDLLYELRRIERYRRQHGVNRQALPLVVGLLHEVERLRAEIRFHREL